MTKYYYNTATGEFVNGTPRGDGFGYTDQKPPAVEHNQSAIFDGTKWVIETAQEEKKTAEEVRSERNLLLYQAQELADRHRNQIDGGFDTTLSDKQYQDLLQYMEALRNLPQQSEFPDVEIPKWSEK